MSVTLAARTTLVDAGGPTGAFGDATDRTGADPIALEPGDRVGRYVVERPLGAGGMGVVYVARDPELDRPVALKLVRLDGPPQRRREHGARLRREARALARLSHPNVVPIYDADAFESGGETAALFIAMELIEGRSLGAWLDSPRTVPEIVDVFVQAARGLAAAHQAGLIHRDFKPANVIVGDDGRVRVVDFGLARAPWAVTDAETTGGRTSSTHSGDLDDEITRHGEIIGTPTYMAPEQHRGLPLGPEADQFGLCVALYRAVYGVAPFGGDTMQELRKAIIEGELRAPPSDERVPGWLALVIRRGLSPEPEDRFASMQALIDALEAGLRRPARARWWMLGGLAVASAGWLVGERRPAPRCDPSERLAGVWDTPTRDAIRATVRASRRPFAADAWTRLEPMLTAHAEQWSSTYADTCATAESHADGLDARMACLEQQRGQLARLVETLVEDGAPRLQHAIASAHALEPARACDLDRGGSAPVPAAERDRVAQVRDLQWRATLELQAGEHARGHTLASRAVEMLAGLEHAPTRARAHRTLGAAALELARREEAAAQLELAHRAAVEGGDDETAARAAAMMATLVGADEGPHEARVWMRHAEAALARMSQPGRVEGDVLDQLAHVHELAGDRAEAVELRRRAIEVLLEADGPDDPNVAVVWSNLGNNLRALGQLEEAAEAHRRALEIRQAALGPGHPDLALSHAGLGLIAAATAQWREAEEHLRRAIEIREAAQGPNSPSLASTLTNLGNVLHAQRRYEDALAVHQRALELGEREYGSDHPRNASSMHNLGIALTGLGRHVEAERTHRHALELERSALGDDHSDVAVSRLVVARALQRQHRFDEARSELEAALPVLRDKLSPDHRYVGVALSYLAEIEVDTGSAHQAITRLTESLGILDATSGDPAHAAAARFTLARALESTGAHERARTEATAALRDLESVDGSDSETAQRVRAWLDEHGA